MRQQMPELDIQLVELLSIQQIPALKERRIDLGLGRLHQSDPDFSSTVLHEEPLVAAVPLGSTLAAEAGPLPLSALNGCRLIVYPKEPRPSYADHVLGLMAAESVHTAEVQDVRELQTALGLVAAGDGLCIIPASARQMRSDVHFRPISDARATSPVILYCRAGDISRQLRMIRDMIGTIFADGPAQHETSALDWT